MKRNILLVILTVYAIVSGIFSMGLSNRISDLHETILKNSERVDEVEASPVQNENEYEPEVYNFVPVESSVSDTTQDEEPLYFAQANLVGYTGRTGSGKGTFTLYIEVFPYFESDSVNEGVSFEDALSHAYKMQKDVTQNCSALNIFNDNSRGRLVIESSLAPLSTSCWNALERVSGKDIPYDSRNDTSWADDRYSNCRSADSCTNSWVEIKSLLEEETFDKYSHTLIYSEIEGKFFEGYRGSWFRIGKDENANELGYVLPTVVPFSLDYVVPNFLGITEIEKDEKVCYQGLSWIEEPFFALPNSTETCIDWSIVESDEAPDYTSIFIEDGIAYVWEWTISYGDSDAGRELVILPKLLTTSRMVNVPLPKNFFGDQTIPEFVPSAQLDWKIGEDVTVIEKYFTYDTDPLWVTEVPGWYLYTRHFEGVKVAYGDEIRNISAFSFWVYGDYDEYWFLNDFSSFQVYGNNGDTIFTNPN